MLPDLKPQNRPEPPAVSFQSSTEQRTSSFMLSTSPRARWYRLKEPDTRALRSDTFEPRIALFFVSISTCVAAVLSPPAYGVLRPTNGSHERSFGAAVVLNLSGDEFSKSKLMSAASAMADAVTTIDLSGSRVTDDELKLLSSFRLLRELNLRNTGIKHVGFIGKLSELRFMNLSKTRISDADAASVPIQFPLLQALEVSETSVTDAALVKVGKLAMLKNLNVAKTSIRGDCFRQFTTLHNLQYLSLANTKIDNNYLQKLPALPALLWLSLEGTKVSDDGIRALAIQKNLSTLILDKTQVSGPGLASLKSLSKLRLLRLIATRMRSQGTKYLIELSSLRELCLSDNQIDDSAVEYLSKLKWLKYLNVQFTNITSAGVAHLKGTMPNVEIDSTTE